MPAAQQRHGLTGMSAWLVLAHGKAPITPWFAVAGAVAGFTLALPLQETIFLSYQQTGCLTPRGVQLSCNMCIWLGAISGVGLAYQLMERHGIAVFLYLAGSVGCLAQLILDHNSAVFWWWKIRVAVNSRTPGINSAIIDTSIDKLITEAIANHAIPYIWACVLAYAGFRLLITRGLSKLRNAPGG